MKNLNKKGISLIVLVITIIVMIILATAIILSLNSSNIVDKAKEAQKSSDAANIKQAATLAYSEYVLDLNEGKVLAGTTAEEYVKAKLISQGIAEENLKTLMVTESGKVYVFKIPEGFVASDIETEDEVSEGLVIYEGTEKVSTDTDAQTTRNQYVWVPVEDEFERVNWKNATDFETHYTEPCILAEGITLSISNDLTGEWAEYAKMKASVAKYGGFYIGRYEVGTNIVREEYKDNGTTTVIPSQKNKIVYDYVGWGATMSDVERDVTCYLGNQGQSAVKLSRSVYPESANKEVVSTLIYGAQWDAALKFISKLYPEYSLSGIGHTSSLVNTGTSNDCKNNIYDMAGNVCEWTMEALHGSTEDIRILRHSKPGQRSAGVYNDAFGGNGFRVALYLK